MAVLGVLISALYIFNIGGLIMIYIGIDPGVNTGFASWDSNIQRFESIGYGYDAIGTLYIHDVLEKLNLLRLDGIKIKVLMEDARKRKWFGDRSNDKQQGAGSIKRDCKIIEDACNCWGIEIVLVDPKSQKGLTKMSANDFNRLTGYNKRTSQHARDAALLVWNK